MKNNIVINAENNELVLRNKVGDYVIIPKKHRTEVLGMLKDGCHSCIDSLVETLPVMEDYAQDGSLYPEEPIVNINNPVQLKEVTITEEAPTWLKYRQAWEKENPFDIDKYVEDRFNNPIGREAIKRINEKSWRETLRQEGLKKRQAELDEATKMGLLYQRFNPQRKDDIAIADEQFKKRYGTSPHRYRYDNDPEYRKFFEQIAENATSKIDYPPTDLRRKDSVAPNNMWMYPNLTGESRKAMTDFSNNVIGMVLPIPGLEAMGKIPSVFKAGKNLVKGTNKINDVVDVTYKIGSPINRPIDIHDVRKKYHNNLILSPEEMALLKKEGKGIKSNYRNITGTDIVGKLHMKDKILKEQKFDKGSIEELLFGKDYSSQKVDIPSKSSKVTNMDIKDINTTVFGNNILDSNIKKEIEELIKSFKINVTPFERTETSMKADKWLSEWFHHPKTKEAFINYGGTEDEWINILNTLDNPIRSSVKYGKNQPKGVYMDAFKQASIPIDATVDVGVHEGIHKTGLLLTKKNPILHQLWNDFIDAVREIPTESYPEIFRLRYNMGLKPGQKIDMETLDRGLKTIEDGYSILTKIKDKNKLLDIINKAPALIPFLGMYLESQQNNNEKQE